MSTLRTNTITNAAGTKSVPVDTVVDGSAKAWVNFNGQGTVAIRQAFNVSSITDNGVGTYAVNFTNAMADANFSAVTCSNLTNTTDINAVTSYSASSVSVFFAQNGAVADPSAVSVVVFR